MKVRILSCLLPLVASAPGQNTLVVDPATPGAFHTLNEAVAAAVDGDLILVRYNGTGYYALAPLVIDKSLRIVGDVWPTPTCLIGGPLTVNLPAGKELTITGCMIGYVYLGGGPGAVLDLRIENCEGRVSIISAPGRVPAILGTGVPVIRNSSQVLFSDMCLLSPAPLLIDHSTVVFDRCVIYGIRADVENGILAATMAVTANVADLRFVDTVLIGGGGTNVRGAIPGAAAIAVSGSTVRFAGPGTSVQAGYLATSPALLATDSTIALDPSVPPPTTSLIQSTLLLRPLLSVAAENMTPGMTGHLTLRSAVGTLGALVFGVPGNRTTIPGVGDLWIDPAGLCVPVLGIQDGSLGWTISIPPLPALFASQFRWQGALASVAGFELSDPGATFLR